MYRPIVIKIKASVSPQEVPFRRRYNLKKVDWEGLATSVDMGITDIVPTPDNYGSFVDLIKKASRQNIASGCCTSYICDLTDETKELYDNYKMQFENDPFNSKTTETGDRLSDGRKAWKNINKLSKDYPQPQQQCKVTADKVTHQLLLNNKGNSTHRKSKAKIADNHITEDSLTSLFTMEELMKGLKFRKNNKAASIDGMLCEQIKHLLQDIQLTQHVPDSTHENENILDLVITRLHENLLKSVVVRN